VTPFAPPPAPAQAGDEQRGHRTGDGRGTGRVAAPYPVARTGALLQWHHPRSGAPPGRPVRTAPAVLTTSSVRSLLAAPPRRSRRGRRAPGRGRRGRGSPPGPRRAGRRSATPNGP